MKEYSRGAEEIRAHSREAQGAAEQRAQDARDPGTRNMWGIVADAHQRIVHILLRPHKHRFEAAVGREHAAMGEQMRAIGQDRPDDAIASHAIAEEARGEQRKIIDDL